MSTQFTAYNDDTATGITFDLTVGVDFIGFAGCDNNTFIPQVTDYDGTTPDMTVNGMTWGSKSTSYRCKNGNMQMDVALTDAQVVSSPKFHFSW